ncbi:MAG: DUF262 domain-containing protein [Roseburia sp.]|nr:DUF262 domain-containing protein [Roseburia sp.]
MSYSVGDGETVRKLLGGMVKYIIPRYQRTYVWKKKHWQDLFEDLVYVYSQNNEESRISHFFSTFILERSGNVNGIDIFTVIDGQQRLSTVSTILSVLCRLLIEKRSETKHSMLTQYLGAKDSKGEYIKISNENADLLGDILTDNYTYVDKKDLPAIELKKYHSYSSEQKNIYCCYMFFYRHIKELVKDAVPEQEVTNIIKFADCLLDMQIVQIIADKEQEGYDIFEILNARGTPLAPHELLKNYIYKYYRPIGDVDNAKRTWTVMENNLIINNRSYLPAFIDHYTAHKYRKPDKKVNTVLRIIKQDNNKNNTKVILEDLYSKSKFYRWLLCQNEFLKNDLFDNKLITENINSILTYFILKQQSQFRPLFLSIFSKMNIVKNNYDVKNGLYQSGKIEKAEFTAAKKTYREYEEKVNSTMTYLLNFTLIELVIKKQQPKAFEAKVHELAQAIERNADKIDTVPTVLKVSITYDIFVSSFCVLGYSNKMDIYMRDNTKTDIRQLLRMYELHLHGTDELTVNNMTIEHILNDSETDVNSCYIGNLIPLAEGLQTQIGAATDIVTKLGVYYKSKFKTVEEFVNKYKDITEWTDTLIAERSKAIANTFYSEIFGLG